MPHINFNTLFKENGTPATSIDRDLSPIAYFKELRALLSLITCQDSKLRFDKRREDIKELEKNLEKCQNEVPKIQIVNEILRAPLQSIDKGDQVAFQSVLQSLSTAGVKPRDFFYSLSRTPEERYPLELFYLKIHHALWKRMVPITADIDFPDELDAALTLEKHTNSTISVLANATNTELQDLMQVFVPDNITPAQSQASAGFVQANEKVVLEKDKLEGLNKSHLDRLKLMIRFQRVTGWRFSEINSVLLSANPKPASELSDENTLSVAAWVKRMQDTYNMPVQQSCNLLGNLIFEEMDKVESQLTKVTNISEAELGPGIPLSEWQGILSKILGVPQVELTKDALTLRTAHNEVSNVSKVSRITKTRQLFGWSTFEFSQALEITGLDKSSFFGASLKHFILEFERLEDFSDWLKDSPFTLDQISFILTGRKGDKNTRHNPHSGDQITQLLSEYGSRLEKDLLNESTLENEIEFHGDLDLTSTFLQSFKNAGLCNHYGLIVSNQPSDPSQKFDFPHNLRLSPERLDEISNEAIRVCDFFRKKQQEAQSMALSDFFNIPEAISAKLTALLPTEPELTDDLVKRLEQLAYLLVELEATPEMVDHYLFLTENKLELSFDIIKELVAAHQLRIDFNDEDQQLLIKCDSQFSKESYLETLALIMMREKSEITWLIHEQGMNTTSYLKAVEIQRLSKIFLLSERLGIDVASLQTLHTTLFEDEQAGQLKLLATALENSLLTSKGHNKEVSLKLQLKRLENERDQLVSSTINRLNSELQHFSQGHQGLYEYLLIDHQVSAKPTTSKIKSAILSMQLYVNRVLNAAEPKTTFKPELKVLWEWMQSYSLWRVHQEIYFGPENYIEPDLRRDSTALFKEAENQLKQVNLRDEKELQSVFLNYLKGLQKLNEMQTVCVGSNDQKVNPDGNDNWENKIYEIFQVARGQDSDRYYYRIGRFKINNKHKNKTQKQRFSSCMGWNSWQRFEIDIKPLEYQPGLRGRPSCAFLHGRWHLFWLNQKEYKATGLPKNSPKRYTATLHYSYQEVDGTWSDPTVLREVYLGIDKIDRLQDSQPHCYPGRYKKNNDHPNTILFKHYEIIYSSFKPNSQEVKVFHFPNTSFLFDESENVNIDSDLKGKKNRYLAGEDSAQYGGKYSITKYNTENKMLTSLPNHTSVCEVIKESIVQTYQFDDSGTRILGDLVIGKAGRVFFYKSYHTPLMGTSKGLYEFNGKTWSNESQRVAVLKELTIHCRSEVNSVPIVGTSKGLYRYRNGKWEEVPQSIQVPEPVYSLLDGLGGLYCGTKEGNLYLISENKRKKLKKFIAPIYALKEANGLIYVFTTRGAFLKVANEWKTEEGITKLAKDELDELLKLVTHEGAERLRREHLIDIIKSRGVESIRYTGGIPSLIHNKSYGYTYRQFQGSSQKIELHTLPPQRATHFVNASRWPEKYRRAFSFKEASIYPEYSILTAPVYKVHFASAIPITKLENAFVLPQKNAEYLNLPDENGMLDVYRLNSTAISQIQPPFNKQMSFIDSFMAYREDALTEIEGRRIRRTPNSQLDFSNDSALAPYFKELLFHLPFLIARNLQRQGLHKQARTWYEYLFNPRVGGELTNVKQVWGFPPFRVVGSRNIKTILSTASSKIPLTSLSDPHFWASQYPVVYKKNLFMQYVRNIIGWGDLCYLRNTRETINEAEMHYQTALTLLGPFPAHQSGSQSQASLQPNQYLSSCLEEIKQRLHNIRQGLTLRGKPNHLPLFQSRIDPATYTAAVRSGRSQDSIAQSHSMTATHYRFEYLIEKAKEMCREVINLNQSLLSASQQAHAEELAIIIQAHESDILQKTLSSRQKQLDEAGHQVNSLECGLESARYRYDYYGKLIDNGLIPTEKAQLQLAGEAVNIQNTIRDLRIAAVIGYLTPTIFGFSNGGFQPGEAINQLATAVESHGSLLNQKSALMGTTASFDRRKEDWQLQQNLAQFDSEQLQYQLEAAKVQKAAATHELELLQHQLNQSSKIEQFYRSKFTSAELYNWYKGKINGLLRQTYEIAHDWALKAQNALRLELLDQDLPKGGYVSGNSWDRTKSGLLSGEHLLLDVQRMEQAYIRRNGRSLEIIKTFSLNQLSQPWPEGGPPDGCTDSKLLNNLKTKGFCIFSLHEKDFATDFPGHYCRQIKSLSISLPMILGPYQNVSLMLTQTSNRVITRDNKQGEKAVKFCLGENTEPENVALVNDLRQNERIAISRGIDDSGMFLLDFNDSRYLPFEGTGVISDWKLEIPGFTMRDPIWTHLNDVIFRLEYTALQGNSTFTKGVIDTLNSTQQRD